MTTDHFVCFCIRDQFDKTVCTVQSQAAAVAGKIEPADLYIKSLDEKIRQAACMNSAERT